MGPHRPATRLRLGPVVGHTDDTTARIWVQVADDPRRYALRVQGVPDLFPFVSSEGAAPEFGTAVATATGLQPDIRYTFRVVRRGRFVPGGRGSVRTMPPPGSSAPILFCAISCNGATKDGVWDDFAAFVEKSQPWFILMMGDQVYMDEDRPDIFLDHFDSEPAVRRAAMAEKYRLNWAREPLRTVMANTPHYMMWDDHDICDGWGSRAADSPTLVEKHSKGGGIFKKSTAYFEDAREVYFHFQACHNPLKGDIRDPTSPSQVDPAFPNYVDGPPAKGTRRAMPHVFRCGRLAVLMLDSRGARDVFRPGHPILGDEQWQFVDDVFARLPADVEALAVMTPTPIASVDPGGQVMKIYGDRTDDVVAFSKGDEKGTLHPASTSDDYSEAAKVVINARLSRLAGRPLNLGTFKVSNIDEARDQWSHKYARPEQADLLRKAGRARLTNRGPGPARELIFLSGDIHVGAIFDITSRNPAYKAVSLTSSGISQVEETPGSLFVGVFVDEDFTVASGVRSTLREVIPDFNFGVIQVQPTGNGATVQAAVAHRGNAFALGIDIADLV